MIDVEKSRLRGEEKMREARVSDVRRHNHPRSTRLYDYADCILRVVRKHRAPHAICSYSRSV